MRCTLLTAAVAGLVGLGTARAAPPDAKGIEFFETKIRPVLLNKCYECHSAKAAKVKGGLLLDSRDGVLAGGDNGPVIVPGKPDESPLVQSLRHVGDLKMPPKEKVADTVLADFVKWIEMGAPDPRTGPVMAYRRMTPEEAKVFYAFQAPRKAEPPRTRDAGWARSDIDRFVLAKMEEKGLQPVADAERRALVRRVYFDLIGLPPTPEQMNLALADKSARWLEKVVDELLASPHYGERWGRHWLDVARYAESNGNVDNTPFPEAWRYRDYVIEAFNRDKPFDRFVHEQIAGDLLPSSDPRQKDEHLTATGFLALTSKPRAQNNPDYRMDLIADQIDTTSRAILGLSVLCARCHDHKFDPISTREYYGLAGFFDSSNLLAGGGGARPNMAQPGSRGLHTLSNGGQAMGISEGRLTDTAVCVRGDTTVRGDTVPRGVLAVASLSPPPAINRSQSGRLELAQWLTRTDNPLTARVAVNRVWMHLFGRGIVASVDNFGSLGERPTHPELLDHLAIRFMEEGWSFKKLIRAIVLSRTYQMGSGLHAADYKIDPDNVWLWRMTPRRLEGEAIRDAMLAVSGQLDRKPFEGSAVAAGAGNNARRPGLATRENNHRSVYLGIVRGAPISEILTVFDVASPNLVVGQRDVTTVPTQALYLMNNPFVVEQSRHLAERLLKAPGADDAARVDLAYQMAYARPANDAERARAVSYLKQATADPNVKLPDAWTSLCQVIFAAAEFRYLD